MQNKIIVDSALDFVEAIKQNPQFLCPPSIIGRQELITLDYYSFDGMIHRGQIVSDKDLVKDVKDAFKLLKKIRFPIESVIPIADPHFHWDDELSMQKNNSSGFNYRRIAKTNKLSNHAFGRAIDINPLFNPFIKGDLIQPKGATYNPTRAGTITPDSEIVTFFKKRGWAWGGDWEDRKDYQHFQKPLK